MNRSLIAMKRGLLEWEVQHIQQDLHVLMVLQCTNPHLALALWNFTPTNDVILFRERLTEKPGHILNIMFQDYLLFILLARAFLSVFMRTNALMFQVLKVHFSSS